MTFDQLLRRDVRPSESSFAVSGPPSGDRAAWFLAGTREALRRAGHPEEPQPGPETGIVLHPVAHNAPHAYRRKSAATFVVAVVDAPQPPADLLAAAYPFLIRSLANLCAYLPPAREAEVSFVTIEQGVYRVSGDRANSEGFFAAVYDRLAPLALSRLVIANEFKPDLPSTWRDDPALEAIERAGRQLDELNLLPAPFPLERYLNARDLRHVRRLFGVGGLSYGNLSARAAGSGFWMSASGVDKSKLRKVGSEVLLVSGFDPERRVLEVSVPSDVEKPRRVSVDAIEHWMIYREHPTVGAIVHVHGWMAGVASTQVNYPCGTIELARAVADLVRAAPDPGRAIVGQKNHGLTITGPNLDEIFARIAGRVHSQVPMAA